MGLRSWLVGRRPHRDRHEPRAAARVNDPVPAADPVEADPVEADPIESDPVEADPVEPVGQQLHGLLETLVAQRQLVDDLASRMLDAHDLAARAGVDSLRGVGIAELRKSVGMLRKSVRRQLRLTSALQGRRGSQFEADTAGLERRLARLADSGRPILVAPWTGDVGLEVLYWVPFVQWFATRFHVPSVRLHVITRGGAPWYDNIAEHATDITALPPLNVSSNGHAERRVGSTERRILRHIRANTGLRHALLHPALMEALFEPFWRHDAPLEHVAAFHAPKPLPAPALAIPGLPSRFLAVRFAFGESFPETAANRRWLDDLLLSLTASHEVVWLGGAADGVDGPNQTEYEPPSAASVIRIDDRLPADRIVAVQAAIVASAEAYVGTYGGLAFVPPLYGVHSVAFYSVRNFFPHHRRVAERVLAGTGHRAPLLLNAKDVDGLNQLLTNPSDAKAV
jgi:hypothetical protein